MENNLKHPRGNVGSISNKLQPNSSIHFKAMLIKVNEWLRLLGASI